MEFDVAEVQAAGVSLYDEMIRGCLDDRVLVFNKEVSDDVIEDYVLNILKWNKEDKYKPVDKRKPIRIYINSPGGDLVVAMHLCDIIQASKTPIVAVGTGLVASAAFHIYIMCHERIAFENTVFLMHDGQLTVQNSGSKAKDVMRFYDTIDERVKGYVLSHTKMTPDYYDDHYDQELYMYSIEAKDLGIVDKIIGTDEDIDYLFT